MTAHNTYAVSNNGKITFIGSWEDCNKHSGKLGMASAILPVDDAFPDYQAQKLAIATLTRDLEQYQMLYTVTNDENEKLIERNSDLITLVTSMSNFITTHMEGR